MLSNKELLDQAISLPVNERAEMVDLILKSLNNPSEEIDKQWIEVAKKRLSEINSGKVKAIPGHEVFQKIKDRFGK